MSSDNPTNATFIEVVFDGPPGPQSGRFIECEGPDGRSIRAGEWMDRGDGLWALRIPASMVVEVAQQLWAVLSARKAPLSAKSCAIWAENLRVALTGSEAAQS